MAVTPSTINLPAIYVLMVLDAMGDLGMRPPIRQALLTEYGLTEDILQDPSSRVALTSLNGILNSAISHYNPFVLAECMGARMKLSSHGFTGFAVMTASNVGEALAIAQKYVALRIEFVSLRLEAEHETCHLFINDTLNLHPLREAVLLALAYGFYSMGRMATGHKLFARVDLDFPEPPGLLAMTPTRSGLLRFGQPHNRFSFSSSYLDYPLLMADPVALRLALEQCEQEMTQLGRHGNFLSRVRQLIEQGCTEKAGSGFPSVEQVAAALHLSSRTLKRQLAQHETSFSELLEESSKRRSVLLLEDHRLSIEHISERLGYSDLSNFTRAFKRWTGLTPKAYRQSRS